MNQITRLNDLKLISRKKKENKIGKSKTTIRQKENKDMSRSNRRSSYEKVNSTYGQITVFRQHKPDNPGEEKNRKVVKKIQEKFYESVKTRPLNSHVNVEAVENTNQDFYGIDIVQHKIQVDQAPEQHDLKSNYFDEVYFDKGPDRVNGASTSHISKDDIENDMSLNYIDKSAFQASRNPANNHDNQKTNQKNKIETIPLFSNSSTELNQAKINVMKQIRSKETKNQILETQVNPKSGEVTTTAKSNSYEPSNHKTIQNEVPKWYKMTIDEGAKLLMKHICHFNINR
jgi:hypothetical protein